ncbi:hypothetical protein FisN_5Hh127 [Fistulifera solaris]|jgi:hypothetical protein|uniref:F-box domain-containing protein n=1 Tax=Fistulifera solaris TaxID=1519565 RepID=A0A1Z5JUD7_FISSO|nr:hypothetical protein FisN_5Hh127 [Fistulifera solaris]|eukprot:GAX17476.1 hypothetical protein FisN_5Hh127 [Fistulifera solaris]
MNFSTSTQNRERDAENTRRSFGLFPYLSDDLKHHVISFIADAPLEKLPENYPVSSLTHSLPSVSKKFHYLSKHDYFWRRAIMRQTAREPILWRTALFRMLQTSQTSDCASNLSFSKVALNARKFTGTDEELIDMVHAALDRPSFKYVYQIVVSEHLRYKGPVLCMPGQIQLGQFYELNDADRMIYKVMRQIMKDHPESARQGGPIVNDAIFVHANRGPLAKTTPAVLVQVMRCEFFPEEERAHVVLLPIAHVWMEKVWLCTKGSDLVYAQCLRMTNRVSADMNRLARQEALAFIMGRVAGEVLESNYFDDLMDDSDDEISTTSSDFDEDEDDLESLTEVF